MITDCQAHGRDSETVLRLGLRTTQEMKGNLELSMALLRKQDDEAKRAKKMRDEMMRDLSEQKEVVFSMAHKLNKLLSMSGRAKAKAAPKEKTPVRKPPKDAGTWVRQWSAQHKREYFFNSETKDTTWRLPEGGLEVLDPKCVAAATSSVPCAIFCLFAQPFSPAFCLAAAEAVLHAGDGNWRMYCNSAAGSCAHMAR